MKSYGYPFIGSKNVTFAKTDRNRNFKTLRKSSERCKNRQFEYEYLQLNLRTVRTVITRAAGSYPFTVTIKTILTPTTQSIASSR